VNLNTSIEPLVALYSGDISATTTNFGNRSARYMDDGVYYRYAKLSVFQLWSKNNV